MKFLVYLRFLWSRFVATCRSAWNPYSDRIRKAHHRVQSPSGSLSCFDVWLLHRVKGMRLDRLLTNYGYQALQWAVV